MKMNKSEQQLKDWLVWHNCIDESAESFLQITRLDLSGKKLEELPENFGLLENLLALNLSNNKLCTLPESMKNLSKLSNLDIRRNRFEILPPVLQYMQLRSINACSNKLSDVSVLEKCPQVRVLDLSDNMLKSLDHCLAEENELRTLNIASNLCHDMSNVFEFLGNVERLNVSENLMKEIPSSIKGLLSIEELNVSYNHIEKIDDAFFDLDAQIIDLSSNLLRTLHLCSLVELEQLTLDDNPFRKLTLDFSFAPYLREFSCDSCGLSEFLLPQSEALELLCYSSNEIEIIPQEIEKYTKLQELDIDKNKISELPDTLANLSYLDILYIGENRLSEKAKKVITILDPDICDINMKTGISIDKAQESDLPQMAELLSVLFAIESDFTINYDKQLSGITRLYEHESSDLLVAKYEDKVIGMITMQRLISSAEGDYVGQIEDLVVHEEYRKMSVGSRLINKMRNLALEHGYKRIQLAADVDNTNALQFYNRRGFKKTHLNIYHYNV